MPSEPDPVPQSMLTHPRMHTIALNTGSSVDTARWCLAQKACSGNDRAAELTSQPLSREKALSFSSMAVWQVFEFWAPSVSNKNRFLAFVKLWSPFDIVL